MNTSPGPSAGQWVAIGIEWGFLVVLAYQLIAAHREAVVRVLPAVLALASLAAAIVIAIVRAGRRL